MLREKGGVCNWVTVCDDVPYINSQMPTQNYENNDTNKYLEPQTRTSLKKKKIILCSWWKISWERRMNHEWNQ